jgi:hypothetical protein
VTVTVWDTAVYASESAGGEEPDAFLRDAALTETDAGERTLLLEPDRVYDIYAGCRGKRRRLRQRPLLRDHPERRLRNIGKEKTAPEEALRKEAPPPGF